jgi:catechol 2,3-dioxygenase-like lactoylglutathione lyase family enzyme
MEPGIPVTGVSELVLEVVDLEAAEAFYAGALGLPVVAAALAGPEYQAVAAPGGWQAADAALAHAEQAGNGAPQPPPAAEYPPPAPAQPPAPAAPAPPAQSLPPPDWYADPHGQARLRYWDGQQWTQHTAQ